MIAQLKLSSEEREMVYKLAEELTGTCQVGNFRHEILVTNVLRRMHKVKVKSLQAYLSLVEKTPKEMPHLMSALTIHTTNWFREKPHYTSFASRLENQKNIKEKFVMLCGASSTGEEVYSFGLVLEDFRRKNPGFEYEIHGKDIDPVSIKRAEKCVYLDSALKDIPKDYHYLVLKGKGRTQGFITVDKEIRKRTRLGVRSLIEKIPTTEQYDLVVCRNVLIYFSPAEVHKIVEGLIGSLKPTGILTVGHSEALDYRKYDIKSMGNSTYILNSALDRSFALKTDLKKKTISKLKVLVVDDSATVRKIICKAIKGVGFATFEADSAAAASEFLQNNKVDIITLDLHMPGKDGDQWLMEQRNLGLETPVIIVSDASPKEAQAVLNALGDGAQDYIEKKDLNTQGALIQARIKAIAEHSDGTSRLHRVTAAQKDESSLELFRPDIILLGASTGGTEALVRTLKSMPDDCPPVVVVQHISADFAGAFADRLADIGNLKLADHLDSELKPGYLYMSVKDEHIGIKKKGSKIYAYFQDSAKVSSHRPSVDFLFSTAQEISNKSFMAVLLTGMGKDGAKGLLGLKDNNEAMTICQDAESSVVWGMPGEATKLGAPKFVGNPESIRSLILQAINKPKKSQAA
ncbi:MAG: chemotaxis protein CheB [Bdellovibrionales bacterium]